MSKRELAIASILVLCLLISSLGLVLGADLNYQVDRSEDDGFKSEIGNMFIATPLIALKDPGADMFSYFMFRNITIYNSRIINNATLSVYTVSNQDADLSGLATIYGLEMDGLEIDDRVSSTTASVVWNVSQVRGLGQWHNVSVTSIVQELIDRFNWDYGDNLAFEILAIPGETRHIVAFDYGNPTLTAKLYISYGIGPPVPPGLPEGAEYNSTYEGYDIWNIPGYGQVTSVVSGQRWDSSGEVYGFQEKTAYSNVTDRFYIFGVRDTVHGRNITYLTKTRVSDVWDENYTLWSTIPDAVAGLYTDYHLWNDGANDYLDVAWIDDYPANHVLYYCRYLLNANGKTTEVAEPQNIYASDTALAVPPVTLMVDSAGYPYVAFATLQEAIHSGKVAWSNTNNGTFNHTASSPTSSESGVTGENPGNDLGPYVHELIKAGNRRVFCAVHVPDTIPDSCEALSGRNINSGDWIGEGNYVADTANGYNYRWALSGSSIRDPSDEWNSSITHLDNLQHELYERPVNVWVQVNDSWDNTRVLIMGATTDGIYYAVGYTENQRYSRYRIRRGSWSETQTLRDFTEYGATHDIALWTLTAQKYPTKDNKTLVSYSWLDGVDARFWHDWFYIEDGPDDTTTDPYYVVTDPNGTKVYENGEPWDWIDGVDPDPQDPEPSGWEGTPPEFSRFSIRRYFLILGYFCVWGPIWFFCWRRPSGYYICGGALIMLMGFGLLLSVQHI